MGDIGIVCCAKHSSYSVELSCTFSYFYESFFSFAANKLFIKRHYSLRKPGLFKSVRPEKSRTLVTHDFALKLFSYA